MGPDQAFRLRNGFLDFVFFFLTADG
jgi:hypothetical protein